MEVIMLKKLLFFALSLFSISPAFAYNFAGQIWQGSINQEPETTYVLLGEVHETQIDSNKVAFSQMHDVISWAKRLNAHVIVEDFVKMDDTKFAADPLRYNNTEYLPALSSLFKVDNQTTLKNFSSLCHLAGISVDSIDCRCLHLDIPASKFYKYLMNMVDHIKAFNDGPAINHIYQEELKEFEILQTNMPEIFQLIKNEHSLTLEDLIKKHNTYTKEHVQQVSTEELKNFDEQNAALKQVSDMADRLLIKNNIQKELNTLLNYANARDRTPQQIISKIGHLDRLNTISADLLPIHFESRLFDLCLLHAAVKTNHRVKIICVGNAHRNWLSMRFKQLGLIKKAECISLLKKGVTEPAAINVNQLFSNYFTTINTKPTHGIAESILSFRRFMDEHTLIKYPIMAGIGVAAPVITTIPSLIAGYVAHQINNSDRTITIGNQNIPVRPLVTISTGLATFAATIYGLHKNLIAPQPVIK